MPITTRHADADLVRAITAYPAMRGAAPVVLPAAANIERPARRRTPAHAATPARRAHRWLPRLVHHAG